MVPAVGEPVQVHHRQPIADGREVIAHGAPGAEQVADVEGHAQVQVVDQPPHPLEGELQVLDRERDVAGQGGETRERLSQALRATGP